MERYLKLANQVAQHGMIANHGLDPGIDASELMAYEQISQAVVFAGGQHHDPLRPRLRQADLCTGRETGQGFRHELLPSRGTLRTIEFGAHVEAPRRGIYELLITNDVASMAE